MAYSVITEQGYPAGQFGTHPIDEKTNEKIKNDENKKKENK